MDGEVVLTDLCAVGARTSTEPNTGQNNQPKSVNASALNYNGSSGKHYILYETKYSSFQRADRCVGIQCGHQRSAHLAVTVLHGDSFHNPLLISHSWRRSVCLATEQLCFTSTRSSIPLLALCAPLPEDVSAEENQQKLL